MDNKNTSTAEAETDFFEVRCKICNKFLFQLSTEDESSTAKIQIKCPKCNRLAKIHLSVGLKQNSIYQRVADQHLVHA